MAKTDTESGQSSESEPADGAVRGDTPRTSGAHLVKKAANVGYKPPAPGAMSLKSESEDEPADEERPQPSEEEEMTRMGELPHDIARPAGVTVEQAEDGDEDKTVMGEMPAEILSPTLGTEPPIAGVHARDTERPPPAQEGIQIDVSSDPISVRPVGARIPPLERKSSRPPPGMSDRRASERVLVTAEVGVHTETNFFTGFTEDISEGGIFVATYNLIPVGTSVDIRFDLPGGHTIETTGHVTWTREPHAFGQDFTPGVGIAFDSIAEEHGQAIARFFEARPPMFHDM